MVELTLEQFFKLEDLIHGGKFKLRFVEQPCKYRYGCIIGSSQHITLFLLASS